VYGLGANALNPTALRSVFTAKGRPMTDPLIVHVTSPAWAKSLFDLDSALKESVFQTLADAFWPGPLTMVARARLSAFTDVDNVQVLSANSGLVGVRIPEHPIARALIDRANVPIAAPSANRFGHVSPTTAQHVLQDLGDFPIIVLDGGSCRVGIESTVLELERLGEGVIVLHRRGGISEHKLVSALKPFNLVLETPKRKAKPNEAAVSPGQLLTHYAPDLDTFLASSSAETSLAYPLSETVFIDFGGQFAHISCLAKRDLSSSGDATEACAQVFDLLRWTESVQGAKCVILPDCRASKINVHDAPALADRLFRAASGRFVKV